MDPRLRELLLSVDDANAYEAPEGFDGHTEMDRGRALKPELEAILSRPLDLDDQVQDASFFTALSTRDYEEVMLGSTRGHALLVVFRFSCFGNLVTCSTSAIGKDAVGAARIDAARELISQRGYNFVDADQLDEPYDGLNQGLKGETWWIRFFDYL